jgi:hypothetical protein
MAYRKQQSTRTPCCPHCTNVNQFALRKDPKANVLPTDHYLRESPDPASRVVCRELLNTKCRFCEKLGHTVSACPEAAEKNKQDANRLKHNETNERRIVHEHRTTPVSKPVSNANRFATLDSESEDDEALLVAKSTSKTGSKTASKFNKVDEFPALAPVKPAHAKAAMQMSFSQAAASATVSKPYTREQFEADGRAMTEELEGWASLSQSHTMPPVVTSKPRFFGQGGDGPVFKLDVRSMNWADYDDLDDDEY